MAIWGSKKIAEACNRGELVSECNPLNISCCSYELSLGNEAYVTSFKDQTKKIYKDGDQIVIEPGQFGILLAKNKIKLPVDVMGFISIKASQKFRGLVNVSGFHVDPGFEGYLKFSVYNAGSQNINLTVGDPLFLIWFSDVVENEVSYSGNHAGKPIITSEDVMRIQGDVASPAALNERIKSLENKMTIANVIFWVIIVSMVVGVITNLASDYISNGPSEAARAVQKRPAQTILQQQSPDKPTQENLPRTSTPKNK
jgi:dCTP deaminase